MQVYQKAEPFWMTVFVRWICLISSVVASVDMYLYGTTWSYILCAYFGIVSVLIVVRLIKITVALHKLRKAMKYEVTSGDVLKLHYYLSAIELAEKVEENRKQNNQ